MSKYFHVSVGGNDNDSGTRKNPFATLLRAQEAVRATGSTDSVKVTVHAGDHYFPASLVLSQEDSGGPGKRITWAAARGEIVRLIGGQDLPAACWQPVEDPAIRMRIPRAAREQVRQLNLKSLGIEAPPFPRSYTGAPPGPELYVNDERMRLACWPNTGWATIAKLLEPGSNANIGEMDGRTGVFEYSDEAPSRWQADQGVWLQGYWCYDWADEVIKVRSIDPATRRIKLDAPHQYSVKQGNPSPRRFRALNVLEELDEPGEFVVDSTRGLLFLLPPSPLETARVTLATLNAPLVAFKNASRVTLRGFTLECGLDNGVDIAGGEDCRIESCEFRNLRKLGVEVTGGAEHRVTDCSIHHTGTGGMVLGGGERKTLQPARHRAEYNHIHHFSEHQRTYASAIRFEGVGNRASHNLIHNAPHQAVALNGNDHRFEYNEIHSVCIETDDCGAIYKGRNPSNRGNLIRFNYMHDIGRINGHGSAAIYFDDGDGGDIVFGNLFVRCGEPGRGSFGTVFSHGGHDIRVEKNVFVDCKSALGSYPWDDAAWLRALKGGENCFWPRKLLEEVDITRPPFTTRYPELKNFMDPPEGAKRVSRAKRNVFVRCPLISGGNWILKEGENQVTDTDPGFPIPLDRIGLRARSSKDAT